MNTDANSSREYIADSTAVRALIACDVRRRVAWPLPAFLPAVLCIYALALATAGGQPAPACNGISAFSPFHPLPTFQQVGVFQAEADFTIGTGRSEDRKS